LPARRNASQQDNPLEPFINVRVTGAGLIKPFGRLNRFKGTYTSRQHREETAQLLALSEV